ncbi:MAG: GEVED domain-containing protein [Saprospiraceae bacterium]
MALQVTNGTGETAYLKIWIDWNGDGLFTMDEEEISLNGASGGAFFKAL